ncbi:3-hydroxyacyl-CoA dehydrogenase [Chelativorans sp.]|uniref:3-hydroxyacyl-CoA dehydrogenase n=1 Tax=Chelativorans sp. TaxID=2203393 RepID=UPI002811E463|nr:3-hydroxyacyl-CoA dehydrogenase [Chelativorans sp.]
MEKRKIAVVGAGLVGCGWAIVFARAGFRVNVFDVDPSIRAAVTGRISAALADMEMAGLVEERETIAARVTVEDELRSAVRGASYVQESVFERQDIKKDVSSQIDAVMHPQAIVGSSSSGIPASAFTEHLKNRERFLVVHPVNPPHLVPLVELVRAPWTDSAALASVRELMEEVGQTPITVRREIEGFVLNRLQGALLNEAWALFEEGYASAEDIDRTVRDGLGLRWSFMGPFETIDLNAPGGVGDYAQRLGPLYHKIALDRRDPRPWSEALIRRVEAERRAKLSPDELAERRAWRDRRLMALVAHRRRMITEEQ